MSVAAKLRAFPIDGTSRIKLQSAIVENVRRGATFYTDAHSGYVGLLGYRHKVVSHGIGEYVRGKAHTNGVESFWALLRRAYYSVFHHMSAKHLYRYVNEFAGQHTMGHDTLACLDAIIRGMISRRLNHKNLSG